MSLIFGINLSNRIYLAADTRLSYFSSDNNNPDKPSSINDDILKIEVLNNDTIVAVAGSTHLAKYLIKNLRKEDFIKKGINVIKENIVKWVAEQVNIYLNTNSYASVCLLFGGIDRSKKKVISAKKLFDLVSSFHAERNVSIGMNDTLFKGISAKPHQPNPYPELPTPDSNVFAVLSDVKKGVLKLEETEWGDYLAYGPKGFRKESLPTTTFGRFEFEEGSGVKGSDQTIITALINRTAETHKFATVGGSIIPMLVDSQGIGVITGKVHRLDPRTGEELIISNTKLENGKIYFFSQPTNSYLPIIPVTQYVTTSGKSFMAISNG